MPGADVGHLAERVELQRLQIADVFHALPLKEAAHVDDERRRAVAEDRRAAEEPGASRGASYCFTTISSCPSELVHHESGAAVAEVDHDDLLGSIAARVPYGGSPTSVAQAEQRQHLVARATCLPPFTVRGERPAPSSTVSPRA